MGDDPFLEITQEEFESFTSAGTRFLALLEVEEKFDIAIENYRELELELLSMILDQQVFVRQAYSMFSSNRRVLNRRLANLLTTCRLYVDQVPRDLKAAYGADSREVRAWKDFVARAYDSSLAYRIAEELRNFLQHRTLAPMEVRFSSEIKRRGSHYVVPHEIALLLSVERLEEDKKFKRSVLADLKRLGEQVNLVQVLRSYVEVLGGLHCSLREALSPHAEEWRARLNWALDAAAKAQFHDSNMLAVVAEDETGRRLDTRNILNDPLDEYDSLIFKNNSFDGLSADFVSGNHTSA